MYLPEGNKRATSVNVQLRCLLKDLRTGSVNFPSELCRRRSGMFTEVARLVPPGTYLYEQLRARGPYVTMSGGRPRDGMPDRAGLSAKSRKARKNPSRPFH